MFTLWRSLQYRTGLYLCRAVVYIFLFKTKSSKLLFIVESSSYRNGHFAQKACGKDECIALFLMFPNL